MGEHLIHTIKVSSVKKKWRELYKMKNILNRIDNRLHSTEEKNSELKIQQAVGHGSACLQSRAQEAELNRVS